ncbi:MAG TPA: HD domain-containing phosphohydrolase [Actinomycetota bacterium]|nr:HD domain-containing phosphohydrolase [Actinomycetota bacterium]
MAGRDTLRLADLLAAVSVATDLGMGQTPEKAIRSCLVATQFAGTLGMPGPVVHDVYLTTLLRHLGCTATAHEEAYLFGGDERASRPPAERTDFGSVREAAALMMATGRGAGLGRPRYLARAIRAGKQGTDAILRAICEIASRLAARLELGPGVEEALYHVHERWDGTGSPAKLRGDDIALPARVAEIATQAIIFDAAAGPDAAVAMVRRRAGGWFDPALAAEFERVGPAILAEVRASDPWVAVLDAEPAPNRTIRSADLERLARAFADMVDLKSPYTLGHSSETAALAVAAARTLAMDDDDCRDILHATLLHDLGRTGVSNGVWDKPGPLSTSQWEQVRLHAYHTERIMMRSAALAPLAPIAGAHHERQDGSGYHRASNASAIPPAACLIAAADAFQAMTQDRPHRPALSPEVAAKALAADATAGRLDPTCVRAVIDAAGQSPTRVRIPWPAGLTDREVEVLRLVALGSSNRELAARLFISPRTAEHHVQSIYAKIGASTRASAALFAMEHGLYRAGDK